VSAGDLASHAHAPLTAVLVGCGAMGTAIGEIWEARGHRLVRRVDHGDALGDGSGAQVAFEFTLPASAPQRVEELVRAGIPTVCGTTGWDSTAMKQLAAERGVPLLVAANFSIGIAVMRRLVAEASRALLPFAEFEPGILERHHSRKKDVPSGTAKLLAATIAEARGGAAPQVVALRQGGQPGEHVVVFDGADESLEIAHRVRTRKVFAAGAVAAAEWLAVVRPPGPVSFEEFLERRSR